MGKNTLPSQARFVVRLRWRGGLWENGFGQPWEPSPGWLRYSFPFGGPPPPLSLCYCCLFNIPCREKGFDLLHERLFWWSMHLRGIILIETKNSSLLVLTFYLSVSHLSYFLFCNCLLSLVHTLSFLLWFCVAQIILLLLCTLKFCLRRASMIGENTTKLFKC